MLAPLNLPPGVWRNGTQYQAKGRWYNANLVRFYEKTIQPWKGWVAHSSSAVSGAARRIYTWIDASLNLWIAVGTHSHIYIYGPDGTQYDVTPSGFTTGLADASTAGGYGGGTYGSGTYGTARGASTQVQDCTVWSLDDLEGTLVGCNADDGKLYSWDGTTSHIMTTPSGSPSNNRALFVTNEGFLFMLGAGAQPRNVQWPDQSTLTSWTPSSTNQAGSYSIQTPGKLMCGCVIGNANVIFTNTDLHLATYLGLPAIYGFQRVGTGCGIISQAAFAKAEGFVAWMSGGSFWMYDGDTKPVPCDVADDVFGNLNVQQQSKVFAVHNPTFGEITWFYPVSTEIDSYCTWNYRESTWVNGALARTCGVESTVFPFPLMVDTSGNVWQHENAYSYSGLTPFIESGPIEPNIEGNPLIPATGSNVYTIVGIEPDQKTLGDVQATFYGKFHATDTDTTFGPYSMANPTSVRMTGREFRMRFTSTSNTAWRVGVPRLDIRGGGLR